MSYYLERGHSIKELINLDNFEKTFMLASATFQVELKEKAYKTD